MKDHLLLETRDILKDLSISTNTDHAQIRKKKKHTIL